MSVNADDSRFVVALTRPGCAGVFLQHFDAEGEGLGQAGSCQQEVEPGQAGAAVAHRGDVEWLWWGNRVSVF
jgi:hypothetical protein